LLFRVELYLTVTQEAVWVGEILAEGDVSVLVVEIGLDRTDLVELLAVGQHEFDFHIVPLTRVDHVRSNGGSFHDLSSCRAGLPGR